LSNCTCHCQICMRVVTVSKRRDNIQNEIRDNTKLFDLVIIEVQYILQMCTVTFKVEMADLFRAVLWDDNSDERIEHLAERSVPPFTLCIVLC
jgi:hypothetical protein